MNRAISTGNGIDMAAVLGRWLLGAVFVYMGLEKALHPVEFLKLLRQYELTQTPLLLNFIASALPWVEVFCGALLLLGVAVRGASLLLLLLLAVFTGIVLHRALALHTLLAIPFCAVKFDCGCGAGEVVICRKLLENAVLLLLSACLLLGRGREFCLCYSLPRTVRGNISDSPEP